MYFDNLYCQNCKQEYFIFHQSKIRCKTGKDVSLTLQMAKGPNSYLSQADSGLAPISKRPWMWRKDNLRPSMNIYLFQIVIPLPEAVVLAVGHPLIAFWVVVIAIEYAIAPADVAAIVESGVIQIGVDLGVEAMLALQQLRKRRRIRHDC